MNSYVLGFSDIDKTKIMLAGGKGANLGELSRIEGLSVPDGFCITTAAYKKMFEHNRELSDLLDNLSQLKAEDRDQIAVISGRIRKVIEETTIAGDIEAEIAAWIIRLGEHNAFAVRSSATAEDLPLASFAGQQDTYLNISGKEAILHHIIKCWASLFTDRAVIYRIQNAFDHHRVYLAVVIQRMVFPQAAGIMFTADPVTSNRKIVSIDAGFGLGEALVSGLVNPDVYKVRAGKIIDKKISSKKLAVHAADDGGTEVKENEGELQNQQTLGDEQIVLLEDLGRKIEDYFSCPQDIEWCLADNEFFVVQSRPITTLYPVPKVADDKTHVFLSVGHSQMMTDPIRPLGISFFQLLGSDDMIMEQAGGRLYFDLAHDLASPLGRKIVLYVFGKNDPLTINAILNLMKREDFMKSLAHGKRYIKMGTEYFSWGMPYEILKMYRKNDPAVVPALMAANEASIRNLQEKIGRVSGDDLFAFIIDDHVELKRVMYNARSLGLVMLGLYAVTWLNKNMEKWLGVKSAADTLSQSVANNVTSEMGLALLDVADVVRQYPAVVGYLEHANDGTIFEDLSELEGGNEVVTSLRAFLAKYGMRGTGEIDITRTRWGERATVLIPMILSNIKNFELGAHTAIFEQKRLEAEQMEQELLRRLEQMPGGDKKAKKTRKMISLLRNFVGYREYPKYAFMQRYYVYKQALLKEAAGLVKLNVMQDKEDIYYLTFDEFREAVNTKELDSSFITRRKEEYKVFNQLTPPRVITSEGEVVSGEYKTGSLPPGALPGLAVSTGSIEGRARVVAKMEEAHIEEGDILVTTFTDPSWTPLFVSVHGLVTEVGGLMTHGAVIAREYGIPAVVGVENVTRLVKDGDIIRVNGSDGYVEVLQHQANI